MADTCATCKFFLANTRAVIPDVDPTDYADRGLCRRYPHVLTNSEECVNTMWCGEFVVAA